MKFFVCVSVLLLCSCGSDERSLWIDLRTDLIPEIEFERIEVIRFDEDGSTILHQEQSRIRDDADYRSGSRVGTIMGEEGEWRLEVRLRDRSDALVLSRPMLVTVRGDLVVTAVMSRDCFGVMCPAALGNPSDTACLGGQCVSPRCTLETPEECGSPQCSSADDCSVAECGEFECLDGYCYASGGVEAADCEEGQYCDVTNGCQAIPTGADADRDRWNDFEDCDDGNAQVFPGAAELCNGIDEDCDGVIDEGLVGTVFYRDADADGFGSFIETMSACAAPAGFVAIAGDCDDTTGDTFPGGDELCDGADNDCDGESDDDDEDGHSVDCVGGPLPADDCDDGDGGRYPGAPERCDAIDNDCDSLFDEAPNGWFRDEDADGYGRFATSCTVQSVDNDLDCDDTRFEINPDATSDPCGIGDQDCDGEIDEDPNVVWYVDMDGDGVGVPGETIVACEQPEGYSLTNLDCDDEDDTRAGGLDELCDGQDNDCDPSIDEDAITALTDNQNGLCFGLRLACVDGEEVAADPSLLEGYEVDEVSCDLVDNDCDGQNDEGLTELLWDDRDGDGFGSLSPRQLCRELEGVTDIVGDCFDGSGLGPTIFPGATEICDGVDQDCDGASDEGEACPAGSLCAGSGGCIEQAPAPTTVSGGITGDVAWEGGATILVTGGLIVEPGSTLSVGPGTTFRFADGVGIVAQGRFNVYGTEAAPVIFESASMTPGAGLWTGIIGRRNNNNPSLNIAGCEIRHAQTAVADGRVHACLLQDNSIAFGGGRFARNACKDCVVNATGAVLAEGTNVEFWDSTLTGGSFGVEAATLFRTQLSDVEGSSTGRLSANMSTLRNLPSARTLSATLSYLESFRGQSTLGGLVRSSVIDVPLRVESSRQAEQNTICSSTGDPVLTVTTSLNLDFFTNNYWCTTDPAEIDALIFDDADDPTLGVLNYTPFLTAPNPAVPTE